MPTINLPWGAWYDEGTHSLQLPDRLTVDVLTPPPQSSMSTEAIVAALNSPIDSPSIVDLAGSRRSACIIVDDLARPTRAEEILQPLLEQLMSAGILQDAIRIVVATGSHGALADRQIRMKVGAEIAESYRVESHDCHGELSHTGIMYGDNELRVNKTFYESELKIAVSSVLPHSFAGYSGGAKMVLPGLTDLQATARSHKFVQLGLRGGTNPNENRFRLEIEDLAQQMGLKFIVCVVTGQHRETVGVYAGNIVQAHRAACEAAREIFRTDIQHVYDAAILNAYPKDVDLIQSENAFVAMKTAKRPIVRDGGLLILTSATTEGVGHHGLFEPGGASYRPPVKKRALGNRDLWLYLPKLTTAMAHQLYWDGYRVFQDASQMAEALSERFPDSARMAVFPCAPSQQVRNLQSSDSGAT